MPKKDIADPKILDDVDRNNERTSTYIHNKHRKQSAFIAALINIFTIRSTNIFFPVFFFHRKQRWPVRPRVPVIY